jgi:exonuclease V
MFSGMESLLSIGKCREMPVVGYVSGMMVMGIIVSLLTSDVIAILTDLLRTRSPDKL